MDPPITIRTHLTLALCTVLHALTHAYATVLVPLYLLISHDLGLEGVYQATLLVTVYGLVYCMGSFAAGILADRFDRRRMLGVGLVGNALAILAMGLTGSYPMLVALSVVAGVFGTLFHPAANALVPAHYPRSPGMAIGVLGMGAGVGFFAGPQFAGWRAEAGQTWLSGWVSGWQVPLVEAGLVGLGIGLLFLLIAREAPRFSPGQAVVKRRLSWTMRRRVVSVALVLGLRDFAGISSITLVSLYLQHAHGLGVARTGFIVGVMMLAGMVANPLMVWLTAGRRRLPGLVIVLLCGAGIIATVPAWPVPAVLGVLLLYQAANLGSFAVSDAAMLERVDANERGRIVGLFLSIAGTMAATGPWIMGRWSDALGPAKGEPSSYYLLFGVLAAAMALAALSAPLIARLDRGGHRLRDISAALEIDPRTLEATG